MATAQDIPPEMATALKDLMNVIDLDKTYTQIDDVLRIRNGWREGKIMNGFDPQRVRNELMKSNKYLHEKCRGLFNYLCEDKCSNFMKFDLDKMYDDTMTYAFKNKILDIRCIEKFIIMLLDITEKCIKKPKGLSMLRNEYRILCKSPEEEYLIKAGDLYYKKNNKIDMDRIMMEILDITKELTAQKTKPQTIQEKEHFKKNMRHKFRYIANNSETLFDKALRGDFAKDEEIAKLEYLFDKMNSIKSGRQSKDEAEKDIGQKFAEEYVQPVIDRLDTN